MIDNVLAHVASLKSTSTVDLRNQWRDLFQTEPPPYNRRFLESRLAYRIQELAYGGLKPETVKRLEALARGVDEKNPLMRRIRADQKPVSGTRLVREWRGVEHVVTVRDDGYEFQGTPYKSLSSVARAITGTRWNGWVFFGFKSQRAGAAKADTGFATRTRATTEMPA